MSDQGFEREPGWLRAEIERAAARSEKIPPWARPVLVKKPPTSLPDER